MSQEHSFGVIPLKYDQKGEVEILLIQDRHGNWGFPKGHAEEGETALESAKRELFEEIGLIPTRWLSKTPYANTYHFLKDGLKINKTVFYFPALVEGKEEIQTAEILSYRWLSFEEALLLCTFDAAKQLIKQVKSEWKTFS